MASSLYVSRYIGNVNEEEVGWAERDTENKSEEYPEIDYKYEYMCRVFLVHVIIYVQRRSLLVHLSELSWYIILQYPLRCSEKISSMLFYVNLLHLPSNFSRVMISISSLIV